MKVIRFYHVEEELHASGKVFQATCRVRNEINGRRRIDEVVRTYPIAGQRLPYFPRKFPTGMWKVKSPIWTTDPEYAPVKIPTDAFRRVAIWDVENGKYTNLSGDHQTDAFYHMHFARDSRTTIGCIRLSSSDDAVEIARAVEAAQGAGEEVWIEVMVSKGE